MEKGAALAGVMTLALLLGSCRSESDGGQAATAGPAPMGTVILRDISFKPGEVTVEVGDTVTWRFDDQGISHDVVADDKSFKSEIMQSGTYERTFDAPGTFPYKCTLHPNAMTGTVVVR